MSSTRDYTRAETSDATTNVPLLSEDSWDDGPSDPVLMITDNLEEQPDVRFSVASNEAGTNSGSPCGLKLTKTTVLVAIIAVLIVICIVLSALLTRNAKSVHSEPKHEAVCVTEGCIDAAHHIYHSMNRSVNPCDNFYEYACGGWAQRNPMPESKSFWGIYSVLGEENERIVLQILTGATASDQNTKKAKTFYDSCMNMTAINSKGAKPLLDIIKKLGGWNITQGWDLSKFDFDKTLQAVQKYSVSAFFGTGVDTDDKDSSKNILMIDQAGLMLPRIYYLKNITDPKLVAYLKYMTTVGVLLGGNENETRDQMRQVLELEIKLAKIFVPPENRSQIDLKYNKTNIMKLQKLCNKIDWLDFFKNQFKDIPNTDIGEKEEVVVYATRYLAALSPIIEKASKTVLNNYMIWRVVSSMAPSLTDAFRDAHEDLHKVLTGSKRSEDLWKRCMGETDGTVGMILGSLFIEKAFEGSSKQQATDMIDAIRASFKKGLPDLDWMDEKTRLAAEDKADAVVDMIGFPDYIKDPQKLQEKYDGLNFKPMEYFQNKRNSDNFHQLKELKRLRQPVDKHKWYMTPSTVNAYYSPSRNQIVFPAGILQAPYYNKKFPKVVNYGGIGAVVGHELSHGFDNSGRMYDKFGNYGVMWWTNRSVEQYKSRADCMVKQYSKFSYFDKHVNGKSTLGENIADNGGLKAAYNAYKEWEKKNGAEPPLPLLNMSADQTFFIAFAQNWCANIRKQAAIVSLDEDPHSPNRFRVLGSVSNLPAFAEAFKCPTGSKMNPSHKCHIW